MAGEGVAPISHWVALLKAGRADAAQPLWEEYFARLVRRVQARLRATGVDDETVAASAFNSFCLAAMNGRFPLLSDRNDLWRLLVFIAGQKVVDHLRRHQAKRRGGGIKFENGDAIERVVSTEPTPEFAAMVADEFQSLLDRLGNESLRKIAVWKMEGLTREEIAERLGCAVRTVSYKLDLIGTVLREGSAS